MIAFIFDCETTGLVKNSLVPINHRPRIIEFFGHLVDSDSGEVLSEVEFFCNPGITLEPIITRITGIKKQDLEGEKPFKDNAEKVAEMIARADAAVAHNLSFDMAMVDTEMEVAGIELSWPERLICTVEETEWMKSHRMKLIDLHTELFGEPFTGAHRARTDVDALTKVYLELVERGEL